MHWSLHVIINVPMREENIKSFISWGTDKNIKISRHSNLFFVLHLLVNSVFIMKIARKAVECVFILIQLFSYLRKQGWLFSLDAIRRIHPWVHLNGLYGLCTSWNWQKIIDFLMILGEGRNLTGLLELVWYYLPNVTMACQTLLFV